MVHPVEEAQYFYLMYLLTHALCFKEERDVHLETGKRITVLTEGSFSNVVEIGEEGLKIPFFCLGGGDAH